MNIQITGNELITKMLNDWYRDIRAQRISEAKKLKGRSIKSFILSNQM